MFKDKLYHYAYEFVGLKAGKMSSRKGKVVLGEDVLDEAKTRIRAIAKEKSVSANIEENAEVISTGAVKFSFLKLSAYKYLAFDFDDSLNFEGFSGPYLQYTYARAQSILNLATIDPDFKLKNYRLNNEELAVVAWLSRFKETVNEATTQLSPHYLCEYVFELAQRFNSFYKKHSVLKAEDDVTKDVRLKLTAATAQVIKNSLYLLGIKVVDKM
jgi:arginyl-tRNA synthetase